MLRKDSRRMLSRGSLSAFVLLLTPLVVADADSSLAATQTHYVENLLGQHDARYMLGSYGRVPLQCAQQMHGA